MDRTTLTAALKPLERDGLITVKPDPADRRSRLLELTKKGHAALAQSMPIWQATHAAIEGQLDGIGSDDLRTGLKSLI